MPPAFSSGFLRRAIATNPVLYHRWFRLLLRRWLRLLRFFRLTNRAEQVFQPGAETNGVQPYLVHQPEPRQTRGYCECKQEYRNKQEGCRRQVEKPNHRFGYGRAQNPTGGNAKPEHGIE